MANQYLNKTGLTRLVYKIKTLIQDMSKEAYLVWGGKNVAGDVSPVDAAACDDTNANRLAFHPADCIDVEYSTDGGNTWLDYGATDVNKTTLVTTSHNFYIGKKSASKATINDKLRITLTAKANQHYWQCKKILMWIGTSGANDCKVLVETRHINETSFSQYGEYNIIGWGGWNSIPCSVMFSAQTNTGFVHKIRLTFTVDSVSDAYNSNLSIGKLRMIAPTCHFNANGELGLNGRIYSLSADKSVTFPNKVTATSFVGATATSTSSGLMSAADKKNLDELPTTKISSSSSSKGVKVSLGGTVNSPTISIETTTNGVASNNSGVVSGAAVKEYVDANKGVSTVFQAQTSSSNAVNGLVPAPSTANTQKYLRGDGTWQTPVSVINNLSSTSTTGALSAAQGKILNEKFGVGVYDLGAFYNYGYSQTEPSNGCLIEIGKAASATMVTLQITGFAYYKRKPINSIFVFYDWKNNSGVLEITQYGGINLGYPVGNLNVYHYDGKVYAWIKQTSDFNTLSFKLYSNNSNLSPIVTKSEMHTSGVTLLTEIEPETPLSAATESSDGLMAATDKKNLNTIKKWYDNIVGVDEDKVINKWDEIVSFLSGIPEGDTLDGLIEAVKTQVGDLKTDIEDGTVIANEAKTLGHETIGSTTNPIYLTSGVAKPCTYTLGTSVPSNAKFTDTNTTYSFSGGTNKFTVTPSGGTAQEVSVTPSITNNVTYSGTLTSGQVAVLDGTAGKIKASGYTISKSVPSNAVFTDTHYTAKNIVSNSASATANVAATNGNVHINLVENNTCRSGIKIVGSGATTVSSDANGNITILSSDTNTTYVAMTGATSTANGKEGLVPKPLYGSENAFLRGDGTWSYRINEFGYTGAIFIGTNFSNATGWFRIARARGVRSLPSVFRIALYRNYSHAVPEAYVFDVCTSYHSYDPISITQVSGQASTVDGNKLIDKIRVTRDTSTSSSIMYFDFHVNLSKKENQFYWYVIGNAFSYTSDEVVHNPTITSTTETHEFETVNGFKTNGDIEGNSRFRSKMRSNPQTSSGVMFDTAPMLINGFIPYTNTEIVESPSGEPPYFGISYLNTSYGYYTSDETFYFTPGEKIKVECWLRRDVGADKNRTKGTFYLGMSFKDKKGHYVNSNAGTVYFNGMAEYQCPCDGVWHHLEAEYTIPKEHTPYIIRDEDTNAIISQSDGGGYYTGTIRSMINYPVSGVNGTTPTYMAGLRITKVAPSASATNKGIQITLGGSPYIPTPTIVVTTSGVSAANSGVVSGAEVKNYVDTNAATRDIFKAATTSSVAVNGLVPAPSSANSTKYLRGDGTWATPTDTNTTYTAGSGLSLSGTAFSLKTGYTTSGKNYGVKVDSNGNPYVNVPWTDTDTNTTYDVVTSSVAGLTPKIGTAAASTIGTQSTEWVLASTSGGTPTWRKLPSNAFLNTTYNAREFVGDYTYDLGSFYSYANGCLIEIGAASGGTMVAIHVTGNGYGATKPINSMYQFYDYNASNGITQAGAICLGAPTGDMVVYRYNNKVYAWIKQQSQFQTLSFRLYTNKSNLSPVVTNAAAHTSGISNKKTISTSGIYAGGNTTTSDWSNSTDARKGVELLQTVGSAPTSGSAPSNYSVGLRVSGYYSFMLANDISNNAMRCYRNSTNGWETFITDKNIATHKAGDSSKLGGVAAASYATKDDITNGNITAAKATNADSATAIGGKGLSDLVQGGGEIKFIQVVTSLPASPSNDTLYLIKQ